ncbi:MAG: gliding motility protein GldL [Bacteroidetes bacterium]|nr:gliding motility protein GldL [Bacteroidota bacterium]
MASLLKNLTTRGNIFIRGKYYKKLLARLYGWGASLVILGALFKINHYPYADEMLLVGLGTEAIIFFVSAFEPPHVEVNWGLVYPELSDSYNGCDIGEESNKNYSQQLDTLLKDANVDAQLIDSLAVGLRNLSDSTTKIKDVSNASLATNEYVDKMRGATSSINDLSDTYKKTSESLSKDIQVADEFSTNVKQASYQVSELSKSYGDASESLKSDVSAVKDFSNTVKDANESVRDLADNYKRSSELVSKSAESLDSYEVEGALYNEQLKKISETMSSLNELYEMQLSSSSRQVESSAKLQETMNQFLKNLSDSADRMISYKQNMDELNQKMASLTKVYGGMLTAMNQNTPR